MLRPYYNTFDSGK